MVNKKAVVIATIVIVIVVTIIVFARLEHYDKVESYNNDIIENSIQNTTENNLKNEVENSVENDVKNETENETTSENNTTENETSNSTESNETNDQTPDEQAISLLKEEWGENDDTVYYYIEEQVSDNVFIISVRDNNTTQELGSYKVNIKTKKVNKE